MTGAPKPLRSLRFLALAAFLLWTPVIGAQSTIQARKWTNFTQMFDAASDGDKIVAAGVVLVRDGHIAGSQYSYSNPAFIYLARVIEQISGDSWATYIQKNVFGPWASHEAILA